MANNHSTLTGLFTDIADAIRAKGGGGSDTLTWDGNTEGLVSVLDTYYKVSSATPTADEMSDYTVMVCNSEMDEELDVTDLSPLESLAAGACYCLGECVLVVAQDNVYVAEVDATFPEKGIYFFRFGEVFTSSLTIPGYTGFASKIIADAFPEAIAAIDTQENLDAELSDQDAKIEELRAALQGKAAVASEDLSAEMTAQDEAIASQDDLIAQIATALEGKTGASGGASVETSTVTIYDNYNLCFDFVSATVLEGDVIDACYYSESNGNLAFDENNYLILNNVVKNSIITILMNDTYNAGTTTTGATLLMEYDFDGGGIHDFKTIFVFKVTDVSARIVLSYDGVA